MGPLPLDSGVSKTGGWQHAAHGLHTGAFPSREGTEEEGSRPGGRVPLAAWGLRPSLWPGDHPAPSMQKGAPRLNPSLLDPPGGVSAVPSASLGMDAVSEDCSALTPSAHLIRPPPEALLMGDHPRPGPSDHRGAVGGLSWVSGSTLGSGTQGWAYVPGACVLVGEPGKGSAMEMGVGCVLESCPRECGGRSRELTLEETDHHTGLGRPGWGHLG